MRVKLGTYNERPINKLGTARYAFIVSNRRQQNARSGATYKGFVPATFAPFSRRSSSNRTAGRDFDLNPLESSLLHKPFRPVPVAGAKLSAVVNSAEKSPTSPTSALSSSATPPGASLEPCSSPHSTGKKLHSPSFNAYCGRRQAAPGNACGGLGCRGALGPGVNDEDDDDDDVFKEDVFTTMTPGRTREEVKGGCFSGAKSYVAKIFENCLSFTERERGPSSKFRRRFQSYNERREQDLVARHMLYGRVQPRSPSLTTTSCPPSSPYSVRERALPHDYGIDIGHKCDDESRYLLEEEECATDVDAISQCPYDDASIGAWSPRSMIQKESYDNGGVERRNTMNKNHVYGALDSSANNDEVFVKPFQGLSEDRITDEQQRRKSSPHDLFTSSGELQKDILCELGTQRTPEQRAHLQMLLSMFSRVNQETLSRCPSVDCCSASVCSLSCQLTTPRNLPIPIDHDHNHAHTKHQLHQTMKPTPMREWECEREAFCVLPPTLDDRITRGGSTRQEPDAKRRNTVFGLQFAHNHSSAPVLFTAPEDADADADLPPSYDAQDMRLPFTDASCMEECDDEDDVQDWSPGRASVGSDEEELGSNDEVKMTTKPFGDLPEVGLLEVNTETNGALNEDEVKKINIPNTPLSKDTFLTRSSTNNTDTPVERAEKNMLRVATRALFEEEERRGSSCKVILRDSIESAPLLAPRFVA